MGRLAVETERVDQARFDAADGAMAVVVLIWAANNVIVKAVLDELAPLAYILARFLLVVLFVFAWLGVRRALPRPRREDVPRFLVVGLSGYAVYNALFTVGLARTSAFSVAVLISLGPVFTLLFATLLGIERARAGQWLGAAVAAGGVALFVGDKLAAGGATVATGARYSPFGDLLSLIAAAAFAVYSLATAPLVRRYGAPAATAWSSLVGLVAIAPFALPAASRQDWTALSAGAWASLLYASAVSMLLAYTLWIWAITRLGVGRMVPYLFLIPVVTGALAAIFLDVRFGLAKIGGAALVLVGTSLVRLLGGARPAPAGSGVAASGPGDDSGPAERVAPVPSRLDEVGSRR